MKRIYRIAAVLPFLALGAMAQNIEIKNDKADLDKLLSEVKILGPAGAVMGSPVKGAPYSATEVTETTQVLADGTRIHNESQVQVYRDSEGRIRRELPGEISIWDPVAGARYSLDPKTQTAREMRVSFTFVKGGDGNTATFHVFAPNAAGAAGGASGDVGFSKTETTIAIDAGGGSGGAVSWTATAGEPVAMMARKVAFNSQSEDLPPQAIEGIMSKGTHTTFTIPAGAIGNDRPIQTVTERWVAPDMGLTLMTRTNDPRSGENYFHLTNVRRGEPDPSLFQVPPGYQVVQRK